MMRGMEASTTTECRRAYTETISVQQYTTYTEITAYTDIVGHVGDSWGLMRGRGGASDETENHNYGLLGRERDDESL